MNRSEATRFQAGVRETFGFLKRTSRLDELLVKAVPFEHGWLLPVADLHRDDAATIEQLGRWRAEHMAVHPTQFRVTADGTRHWLARAILDEPDRLLLLVSDQLGRTVGHLGFSCSADPHAGAQLGTDRALELGYVLRGETTQQGTMGAALRGALDWCRDTLAPEEIFALSFSDNSRALDFFRGCGGVARGSIPLRRHEHEDRIEYLPISGEHDARPPDRSYALLSFPDERPPAERVELATPSITAREAVYALDAARTGWGARRGEYLDRLATAFADQVGVRFALPTSSCTGAMHLALLAAGIGPGDEVIVPDLTWVATANVVALTGASPVFVDIDATSWGMSTESLRAALTSRTRAVIPVHLYGYPARADAIRQIADEHGLFMLEDAAAAVGATVGGRQAGAWGDMSAFSFQGAKLIVAGEGGMLVTDDRELYERAAHLLDQARGGHCAHPFWTDTVTPKYKMSNAQAALALAQLERIDWLLERKRQIHNAYREELAALPGVRIHGGDPDAQATHWMTSIVVAGSSRATRDDVIAHLRERSIDTRPTFLTLSRLPMWQEAPRSATPIADSVASSGINLPSGVGLRRREVARVRDELRGYLADAR